MIIEGLVEDWPARKLWTREGFRAKVGPRAIAAADGFNMILSKGRVRAVVFFFDLTEFIFNVFGTGRLCVHDCERIS